jgi:hypothetical protein
VSKRTPSSNGGASGIWLAVQLPAEALVLGLVAGFGDGDDVDRRVLVIEDRFAPVGPDE